LNAADEIAVNAFLQRKIGFMDIPAIIEAVMERHRPIAEPDLNTVWEVDEWARATAWELVQKLASKA
jgi:1-deoxy-D-xylulose-5-phosphate reductoisomerase